MNDSIQNYVKPEPFERDPDLSILDSTPTHDEARYTDVPPPALATEKRPKKSRAKKDGGDK